MELSGVQEERQENHHPNIFESPFSKIVFFTQFVASSYVNVSAHHSGLLVTLATLTSPLAPKPKISPFKVKCSHCQAFPNVDVFKVTVLKEQDFSPAGDSQRFLSCPSLKRLISSFLRAGSASASEPTRALHVFMGQ